jgi:hypothetical protein
VYAELSFPVDENGYRLKWSERYERTEINSFYSNAQQQIKVPGYNAIVPSYFIKKIWNDATIKLSYSKRIEQPDYGTLTLCKYQWS